MAAPLVSVVTPVWNAAATLEAAVASVRAQASPTGS
jgi:glycosyltransferase involved in cell wall biosynthesis